jgi:predicted kinase
VRQDAGGGPRIPAPTDERFESVTAPARTITLPDPGIVVLVGPAGSGKSSFAARHLDPGDVLSSDAFRALVAGDPGDQSASGAAFSLLHRVLDERTRRQLLTVVDATNLTPRERRHSLDVAREHGVPSLAIVFGLPLEVCQSRAARRTGRIVPAEVVADQYATFRRHLPDLADEPFDDVVVVTTAEELDHVEVTRATATRAATSVTPDRTDAGQRPPAVVIDLDGTLTSAAWRVRHLEGKRKDWSRFFAGMARDAPVRPLVDLAEWIAERASVVLLTGRPDDHEDVIRRWLRDHRVPHELLLMRSRGDRRPDTIVKRERYRRDVVPHYDVRLVIDDRPSVIEMWREEGLYVLTAVDPHLDPLQPPGT